VQLWPGVLSLTFITNRARERDRVLALSSRRRCLGMGLLRAKLESGEAGDGGGWWRVRALSAPRRVGGSVASG